MCAPRTANPVLPRFLISNGRVGTRWGVPRGTGGFYCLGGHCLLAFKCTTGKLMCRVRRDKSRRGLNVGCGYESDAP